MKKLLLFMGLFILLNANSQNTINLQMCIDSAIVNYPLYKTTKLIDQQQNIQLDLINNNNLPTLNLNAKASIQNKVIELPFTIPNMTIPEMNKDQYKISLDIQQSIYKGGLTIYQKQLANSEAMILNAENEIDFNNLKQKIIALYFQTSLNRNMISINKAYSNTLESKINEMEAAYKQGIIQKSALDQIKVELLNVNQNMLELVSTNTYLLLQLADFTKINITPATELEIPDLTISNASQKRPEYNLMTLQQQKMTFSKGLYKAKNLPMIYGYSTIGYGRPGLNYLSNNWDSYIIVGLGLNWNIWDWNASKNQSKIIDINVNFIENQKEAFTEQLNNTLIQLLAEIGKYKGLIENSEEIISLRTDIATTSESQLKNGIITPSEYIIQIQNLNKSKQDLEIYKIKHSLAKTNYLWALGNL